MVDLIDIDGVGVKTIELFKKLGINEVNDLLCYYPFRYDILKRSDVSSLNDGDKIIIDGISEKEIEEFLNVLNKIKGNVKNYNILKEEKKGR